jgi:thiol-disulfide isomerase/thioredoxin
MIRLLLLTLAIGCGACGPAEVEITDDSAIVGIGQPTTPVPLEPQDPYPWATWETCAHDIGNNPCNFELMDQYGEQSDLYQHYGKVIVIDLSAMWCGPCNMIAPVGDLWVQSYGDENFVWVTILIEDASRDTVELTDLEDWAATHGVTLPVLAGSRAMIDLTEPLEDGYPVTSWPTLVVIDSNMVLQHGLNGWNEGVIQGWVEGLL